MPRVRARASSVGQSGSCALARTGRTLCRRERQPSRRRRSRWQQQHHSQTVPSASWRLLRRADRTGRRPVRRARAGLQRDDRPAPGADRPLHVGRRRGRRDRLRRATTARSLAVRGGGHNGGGLGTRRRRRRDRPRRRCGASASTPTPARCGSRAAAPGARSTRRPTRSGMATPSGDHRHDRRRRADAGRRHRAPQPPCTASPSTTCSRPRSCWPTARRRARAPTRTRICSGRSAAAAATSASSPRSCSGCIRSSTVVAGPTFWPIEQSAEVLRAYREFLPAADRDLNGFFAVHVGAAGAAVPGGAARPPGVRHRVVPPRLRGAGRGGDGADARGRHAAHARRRRDAVPRPSRGRSTRSTRRAPVVLAGGLRPRRSPTRRSRRTSSGGRRCRSGQSTMHLYPIDGAVHDVGRRATRRSATATSRGPR